MFVGGNCGKAWNRNSEAGRDGNARHSHGKSRLWGGYSYVVKLSNSGATGLTLVADSFIDHRKEPETVPFLRDKARRKGYSRADALLVQFVRGDRRQGSRTVSDTGSLIAVLDQH
jgi:hypothetical protein